MTSMRNLGGLTLLLAGIGVALLVYLPAPVDSPARRSPNMAAIKFKPVSRLDQFSPSIALSVPTPLAPRLAGLEIVASAVLQAAVVHETQLGWHTMVVAATTTGPTELTPRDADARNKLAQEIQQQLRRVGCYWGRVDGSWDLSLRTQCRSSPIASTRRCRSTSRTTPNLHWFSRKATRCAAHVPPGSRYRHPGAALAHHGADGRLATEGGPPLDGKCCA